jgi:multidrug efflux pump subunit AcrA (membrane-fusion protein)
MKTPLFLLAPLAVALTAAPPREDLVILSEAGIRNLRIQTATAEPTDFEETVFALGRLEARPERVAAVASSVPGRVVALGAVPGDTVALGAEILRVESRQPGSPAPTISLTTPLAGVVTRLDVRLGEPVEPDRALLEVTDLRELFAVARVPEHWAGRIPPGATARVTVTARPGIERPGRLLRLGTAADTAAGTIDAVFVLSNEDGFLRPGMRAEFSIVIARREGVVSVPRSALQGEPSNRFVYVRDFDLPQQFIKTPVVVGQSNDRVVEIISGLLPADEVVTQGAYSLAFAGGGNTLSLKEALDAAHGHAHNPDGTEMSAAASTAAEAGHDHDHAGDEDHGHERVWMAISAVLLLALIIVGLRRRTAVPPRPKAS